MAVLRNISGETLSLFTPSAPPTDADGEITVRDENFVDRAWPKGTWELVSPPELDGYADASIEDAWVWLPVTDAPVDLQSMTKAQLVEHADASEVDLGGASTKADIIAAILTAEGA